MADTPPWRRKAAIEAATVGVARAPCPARRVVERFRPGQRNGHHSLEGIISLNSRQRAQLKSLAHKLKPLLHIGKEGASGAVVESVREAFNTRELLKVRILESAPQPAQEVGEDLAWRLEGVELVQVIGRTVVLYRPHPEKPEIRLA